MTVRKIATFRDAQALRAARVERRAKRTSDAAPASRTSETPQAAYAKRRASIDALLKRLSAVLETYDGQHRDAPTTWSVIGDLGAAEEMLGHALTFLGGKGGAP